MANIYGQNYTKGYISVPAEMAKIGEVGGVKRVLFDQVVGAAGADVLYIGKLPKGARILEVKSIGCDSPTFNIAAGAELSADTNVTVTLGAAPSAVLAQAWVEYVID